MSTTLVARFPTRADTQRAVVDLERHGAVDADNLELAAAPEATRERKRRAEDHEAVARLGVPAAVGGVLATILGAAVFAAVALAVVGTDRPAVVVGSALGGGALIGALGFYWAAASRLPVTEDALVADAATDEPGELVVHLPEGNDPGLIELRLRDLGAESVERR